MNLSTNAFSASQLGILTPIGGTGRGRDTSRPNICAGRGPNQGGPMSSITYELFTVKYAHHDCPTADNFVFSDGVYDGPGPLDFLA